MIALKKQKQLLNRKRRIRKKVSGTAERPRLSLCRTHLHLHAQLIDDVDGKTLFALSTGTARFKSEQKNWGNVQAAKKFGEVVGEELAAKQIKQIVFDRSGRPYHGRIKVFADALREKGIRY